MVDKALREKIAWTVATVAGILAIAGKWHDFGWTTPHQHAADVNDFRMEWRCDEDQEELTDLLRKPTRTDEELERVLQLRDKLDENDCHLYE